VKSRAKLQEKLLNLLRGTPALRILPPPQGVWNERDFWEVAWVVQDFVNSNPDVIECDPLKDWLEEYRFAEADLRGRKDWLSDYRHSSDNH
jgi:hypothetical protein